MKNIEPVDSGFAKSDLAEAATNIIQLAGGDPPEAVFFWCKDGTTRMVTNEQAFEPCEGCNCGWADLLEYAEVNPANIRKG